MWTLFFLLVAVSAAEESQTELQTNVNNLFYNVGRGSQRADAERRAQITSKSTSEETEQLSAGSSTIEEDGHTGFLQQQSASSQVQPATSSQYAFMKQSTSSRIPGSVLSGTGYSESTSASHSAASHGGFSFSSTGSPVFSATSTSEEDSLVPMSSYQGCPIIYTVLLGTLGSHGAINIPNIPGQSFGFGSLPQLLAAAAGSSPNNILGWQLVPIVGGTTSTSNPIVGGTGQAHSGGFLPPSPGIVPTGIQGPYNGNFIPTNGNTFPTSGNYYPPGSNNFATGGLLIPPNGNTYPTNGNIFPTSGVPYPTNGNTYPTSPSFPTGGSYFPTNGYTYPPSGSSFPIGSSLPNGGTAFPSVGSPFPTNGNMYPTSGSLLPSSNNIYPSGGLPSSNIFPSPLGSYVIPNGGSNFPGGTYQGFLPTGSQTNPLLPWNDNVNSPVNFGSIPLPNLGSLSGGILPNGLGYFPYQGTMNQDNSNSGEESDKDKETEDSNHQNPNRPSTNPSSGDSNQNNIPNNSLKPNFGLPNTQIWINGLSPQRPYPGFPSGNLFTTGFPFPNSYNQRFPISTNFPQTGINGFPSFNPLYSSSIQPGGIPAFGKPDESCKENINSTFPLKEPGPSSIQYVQYTGSYPNSQFVSGSIPSVPGGALSWNGYQYGPATGGQIAGGVSSFGISSINSGKKPQLQNVIVSQIKPQVSSQTSSSQTVTLTTKFGNSTGTNKGGTEGKPQGVVVNASGKPVSVQNLNGGVVYSGQVFGNRPEESLSLNQTVKPGFIRVNLTQGNINQAIIPSFSFNNILNDTINSTFGFNTLIRPQTPFGVGSFQNTTQVTHNLINSGQPNVGGSTSSFSFSGTGGQGGFIQNSAFSSNGLGNTGQTVTQFSRFPNGQQQVSFSGNPNAGVAWSSAPQGFVSTSQWPNNLNFTQNFPGNFFQPQGFNQQFAQRLEKSTNLAKTESSVTKDQEETIGPYPPRVGRRFRFVKSLHL